MLTNLSVLVVSLALSLYAADWLLGRLNLGERYIVAIKQGVEFDTRPRLQVVIENRKAKTNWYPMKAANHYLFNARPLYLNGERILPFGEVALSHVVSCNEGGYHSTYATDEVGFRNPQKTWPLADGRHIFLVGDSFTQGACVNDGESIADYLRSHSLQIVNLGMAGNGPLFEIATIREYVPAGKTQVVFWIYCEENDLTDLYRELQDPILRNYLSPNYQQGLWARQKEINALIASNLEDHVQSAIRNSSPILPNLVNSLRSLRYSLPRTQQRPHASAPKAANLETFFKVLLLAKQEVELKGGRLVFVYLPHFARFSGKELSPTAKHRTEVLTGVLNMGIPVIDIEPIFRAHPDPVSLFPLRMNGHYTPEGYRLVANALYQYLKQDKHSEQQLETHTQPV